MSVCTFIASDHPLPEAAPSQDYPLEINIDTGILYDGGADDNFFLYGFDRVQDYTSMAYGVRLEWNYTRGRAERILNYLREALRYSPSVEFWHAWLLDDYEWEDRPVIHNYTVSIRKLTPEHIREMDEMQVWNTPDRRNPERPSFYRWKITR